MLDFGAMLPGLTLQGRSGTATIGQTGGEGFTGWMQQAMKGIAPAQNFPGGQQTAPVYNEIDKDVNVVIPADGMGQDDLAALLAQLLGQKENDDFLCAIHEKLGEILGGESVKTPLTLKDLENLVRDIAVMEKETPGAEMNPQESPLAPLVALCFPQEVPAEDGAKTVQTANAISQEQTTPAPSTAADGRLQRGQTADGQTQSFQGMQAPQTGAAAQETEQPSGIQNQPLQASDIQAAVRQDIQPRIMSAEAPQWVRVEQTAQTQDMTLQAAERPEGVMEAQPGDGRLRTIEAQGIQEGGQASGLQRAEGVRTGEAMNPQSQRADAQPDDIQRADGSGPPQTQAAENEIPAPFRVRTAQSIQTAESQPHIQHQPQTSGAQGLGETVQTAPSAEAPLLSGEGQAQPAAMPSQKMTAGETAQGQATETQVDTAQGQEVRTVQAQTVPSDRWERPAAVEAQPVQSTATETQEAASASQVREARGDTAPPAIAKNNGEAGTQTAEAHTAAGTADGGEAPRVQAAGTAQSGMNEDDAPEDAPETKPSQDNQSKDAKTAQDITQSRSRGGEQTKATPGRVVFHESKSLKPEMNMAQAAAQTNQSGDVRPAMVMDTAQSPVRQAMAENLISQIIESAELQNAGDGMKLSIELNPKLLGKITLELVSQSGALTAKLHAENDAVRHMLGTNLDMLKDQMKDAGIHMQNIEVGEARNETAPPRSQMQFGQSGQERSPGQNGGDERVNIFSRLTQPSQAAGESAGLDVSGTLYRQGRVAALYGGSETGFDYRA